MDRLVELFRRADEKASWVRQPIARYLMECPLPEAKQHLEELKRVDAESIQRAGSVLALLAGRNRGAKNDIPGGGNGENGTGGAGTESPGKNGKSADDKETPNPVPAMGVGSRDRKIRRTRKNGRRQVTW